MTTSATLDWTTADAAARVGTMQRPAGPRRIARLLGTGLSGILTLLFFVCALLPLLHLANDVPRGFEVRPVLVHAARLPVSDAGSRVSSAAVDIDDVHEEVAPPRLAVLATLDARRHAAPRSVGPIRSTRAARLERPPRPVSIG